MINVCAFAKSKNKVPTKPIKVPSLISSLIVIQVILFDIVKDAGRRPAKKFFLVCLERGGRGLGGTVGSLIFWGSLETCSEIGRMEDGWTKLKCFL